ncbi:MAG: hypothetical protein WD738_15810 [Pirellulales bacterium]
MIARSWNTRCCLVTCCGLIGCGSAGTLERAEVRGKAAYAGKPVENGEIRFFPIDGTLGPVSGAPIIDGEYHVTHRGGVPVGSHRVEVEAFRSSQAYPELNAEGGHREQFLPRKYNISSELTAIVPGERPVFTYDLNLPK